MKKDGNRAYSQALVYQRSLATRGKMGPRSLEAQSGVERFRSAETEQAQTIGDAAENVKRIDSLRAIEKFVRCAGLPGSKKA
jgi:hypothetical protein